MAYIRDVIPFSLKKDLGAAYNQAMAELPTDDSWAMLRDADTMFLTPDYMQHINSIVDKHPNTGIFTCLTNRVGNKNQCYGGRLCEVADINYHRRLAIRLNKQNWLRVSPVRERISGMLMIIQKRTWQKIKFKEGRGSVNLLTVDIDYSRRILSSGRNILRMDGIYLFHYYRLAEGRKFKTHLK